MRRGSGGWGGGERRAEFFFVKRAAPAPRPRGRRAQPAAPVRSLAARDAKKPAGPLRPRWRDYESDLEGGRRGPQVSLALLLGRKHPWIHGFSGWSATPLCVASWLGALSSPLESSSSPRTHGTSTIS